MPVVRLLFFILLLVNILAFTLLQGWLGSSTPRGEPERLTNQLRPEQIVLGPPLPKREETAPPVAQPAAEEGPQAADEGPSVVAAEAPPAPVEVESPPPVREQPAAPKVVAVPPACVRYADLGAEQAEDLIERARRASKGFKIDDVRFGSPNGWWVFVPPLADRQAANGKVADLRALGVKDLFILQDSGPYQYAVSLGVFKTEGSAKQHLARMQAQGVRSAQVAQRTTEKHRVDIRGPGDVVSSFASDLGNRYPGATRLGCAP